MKNTKYNKLNKSTYYLNKRRYSTISSSNNSIEFTYSERLNSIIKELGLNPEILNVNGGAIALGHPLGCTGTKLTVQLLDEMRRRGNKYGMVTMCVGTGQGAASIFELL